MNPHQVAAQRIELDKAADALIHHAEEVDESIINHFQRVNAGISTISDLLVLKVRTHFGSAQKTINSAEMTVQNQKLELNALYTRKERWSKESSALFRGMRLIRLLSYNQSLMSDMQSKLRAVARSSKSERIASALPQLINLALLFPATTLAPPPLSTARSLLSYDDAWATKITRQILIQDVSRDIESMNYPVAQWDRDLQAKDGEALNARLHSANSLNDPVLGSMQLKSPLSKVELNRPESIALDAVANRLYVADASNNRIVVLSITDNLGHSAGLELVDVWTHIPGTEEPFNSPYGLAINQDRLLIIVFSDMQGYCRVPLDAVQKTEYVVELFPGAQMGLDNAHYVTCDSEGCFYITDQGNKSIHKLDSNGLFVKTFPSVDPERGPLVSTKPQGIAVTSRDHVIVLGYGENTIYEYSTDGVLLLTKEFAGVSGSNYVCRGPDGGYLISDYGGSSIYFFDENHKQIKTISIRSPTGMCWGPDDCLFVSGWSDNIIFVF